MKEYLKAIVNDREFRRNIGDPIVCTMLQDIIEHHTDTEGVIPELIEAGYLQQLSPYFYLVEFLPEELDFALEVFYLIAVMDCNLPTNVPLCQKDFNDALWRGCGHLGINRDRKRMWDLFKSSKYFTSGLSLKAPSELDLKLTTDFQEDRYHLYRKFREWSSKCLNR